MRRLKPVLSVSAMLTVWGCSSTPLVMPTVLHQPATPCLTQCIPLPVPVNSSDLALRNWEYMAVEAFGACRRLHQDCVAAQ